MTQFEKSISNKSYTNKDFGTIYPELLDLAKKLSYKWDPTISDESDPGVVLIKLAAILADKLNYNIDKNILELYPVSVTQLANARKVFLDNGYKMQYYQSAVAPLSFYLNSEPEISDSDAAKLVPDDSRITAETILNSSGYPRTYIIPKYTMFTDTNTSVVYTLTENVYLSSNMASATGNAIQGKIVQLNVGGSTVITADTLKDTTIVRLPDTQVAENGVFVTSVDSEEEWTCVDNILVEAPGTRCYEFGISPDGRTCYIEFPEDILQMIGGGLTVHYIVTSGYNGNISTGYINNFFTDTTINRYINKPENTQAVSVTSDNISISNKLRTLTGKDPESIESAYRNYKRTRNTFHTLVSTQDYSNFIYTNNDVSNGFVCDRNDDIQSSITLTKLLGETETEDILTRNTQTIKQYTGYVVSGDKPTTEIATIQVVEETPEMTAFDLRLYGLQYVEAPSFSAEAFNNSFQPLIYDATEKSNEWKILEEDMSDLKCISHNFVEFIPNRLFMLKNRFPIVAKLVSSSMLTLTQKDEILRKAQRTLYELLNSRVIEFGAEIDYTEVYNALSTCDARINAIMLNEFRYETFAVYVDDNGKVAELRIDASSTPPMDPTKFELWETFRNEIFVRSMLAGTTQPFVKDTSFTYQITQHPVEFSTTTESTQKPNEEDTPGGSNPDEDPRENQENPDEVIPPPPATPTPPVVELSTEIALKYHEESDTKKNWWESDPVPQNSTVVLTAPNLISGTPFTSYVKFVHNIGLKRAQDSADTTRPLRENLTEDGETAPQVVVYSNEDYVLEMGEYIIFFWKDEDSTTAPYKYKKLVGTADTSTIICPTRTLLHMPNPSPSATIENNLTSLLSETAPLEGTVTDTKANEFISSFLFGEKYDIKTDSIAPKTINRIQINDRKNRNSAGQGRLYWILNSSISDSKDSSKTVYRLFAKDETKYTLQQNETVIYTNNSNSELYLLGSGTVIERVASRGAALPEWVCPTISETSVEYLMKGPQFFDDPNHRWFTVNSNDIQVFATEMEYYVLDKGHSIKLTPYNSSINSDASTRKYNITANGILLSGEDGAQMDLQSYDVSYFDAGGNETKLSGKHHASIKWEIYTQLNLNVSPDQEFILDEGESIAGYDPLPNTSTGGITPGEVESTVTVGGVPVPTNPSWIIHGSTETPVHIQSDVPINITGNTLTNIEYVDIFTGERKPPSLFIYTTTTTTTDAVTVGTEFTKVICSPGSYILPVQLTDTSTNRPPVITFKPYRNVLSGTLTDDESIQFENFGNNLPDLAQPSFASFVEAAFNNCYVSLNGIIPQTHIKNSMRLISKQNVGEGLSWSFDPDRKTSEYVCKYFGTECSNLNLDNGGQLITDADEELVLEYVYDALTKDAQPGDVSFIITDVGTYIALQGTNGYTLYAIERSVAKVQELPLEGVSSVNGFTLRFADSKFQGNNVAVKCKTLLQYLTEDRSANITSGKYYFCLDIPEGIVYYDLIIGDDNDKLANLPPVSISNLYKYTMTTLSPTVETKFVVTDDIKKLLRQFDKDGYFDYVRTPDSSHEVAYPLDSISFCDENHVFNKCTICQYTPKSERLSDIQVVNKLR